MHRKTCVEMCSITKELAQKNLRRDVLNYKSVGESNRKRNEGSWRNDQYGRRVITIDEQKRDRKTHGVSFCNVL